MSSQTQPTKAPSKPPRDNTNFWTRVIIVVLVLFGLFVIVKLNSIDHNTYDTCIAIERASGQSGYC